MLIKTHKCSYCGQDVEDSDYSDLFELHAERCPIREIVEVRLSREKERKEKEEEEVGMASAREEAKALANGIIKTVHLFYQNDTAIRYLDELIRSLTIEHTERRKKKYEKIEMDKEKAGQNWIVLDTTDAFLRSY